MSIHFEKFPVPFGFQILRKRAKVNPLIINYHIVSDNDLPYINQLYKYRSVERFIEDIDFFISEFQLIGLNELLKSIEGNTVLPQNAAILTFDDGFKEIYEVIAPILLEKKITATFFLTSDFIDNKSLNHDNKQSLVINHLNKQNNFEINRQVVQILDKQGIPGDDYGERILNIPYLKCFVVDEIASLLDLDFGQLLRNDPIYVTSVQIMQLLDWGFTIGGHSKDHARFDELSVDDQIDQTLTSVNDLVEKFSLPYRVFAFPYTDMNVSSGYFQKVSGRIDATFGTQGLLEDPIHNNFQRISVEKYPYSARRILKYHYIRKIIYDLFKKGTVKRPYQP